MYEAKKTLEDKTSKKRRTYRTLDTSAFEWIERAKKERMPGRPSTNAERQRFFHIRKVALKELEDLTRLAECLPEDQLQQIFNVQNLRGFFRALLNLEGLDPDKDREMLRKKRHLLPICYLIIVLLNDSEFARTIAPNIFNALIFEGGFAGIKTIYYRSLIDPKDET